MKKVNIYIFASILTFNFSLLANDSLNQGWYSKAIENIAKQEYNIYFSEETETYQSPNRSNNLRFVYKNNGFIVSPRVTETFKIDENNPLSKKEKIKVTDDWKAEFTVLGYGRDGQIEMDFVGTKFIVEKNTAQIKDENLRIDYLNNEKGMRQDFTIYNKPLNDNGLLTLLLEIETNESLLIGADALVIKSNSAKEYMRYNSLKIWDAKGNILRGRFENVKNSVNEEIKKIQIVVNDENAKYPITIDPLSTNEKWFVEGTQADAEFGFRVATAGDVNGDGFSDVIISSPSFDNKGKVFVYHGSSSGPSTIADWEMLGSQVGSNFGFSISTAGDIDGNGFSDIIVGIPNYGSALPNEGRAIVYYGYSSGLSYDEGEIISGGTQNIQLGYSVTTAGDVDGDGYSDVIISAPFFTQGQSEEGRIFVYYGDNTGLNLSNFWFADGDQASAHFGKSVSTAGDFNGDGFSDIIIGNPDFLTFDGVNPISNAGLFIIYFGSGTGITGNLFKFGDEGSGNLGKSVFTAGDVNGDGYSDVIIGKNSTIDAVYRGVVEVYHGYDIDSDNLISQEITQAPDWSADLSNSIIVDGFGDAVSTAGDVNGDGYADVIIGAKSFLVNGDFVGAAFLYQGSSNGLGNNNSWMKTGNQNNGLYGASVGIAGDVNGDGYSDVIIGESDFNSNGKAYIYYGTHEGIIDNNAEELFGTQIGSEAGKSVSTAGDVNGDGYSDIIIGVPEYDNGQQSEGAVFIYYGANNGIVQGNKLILEGNQVDGNFGSSVSTAGDVNGDGYVDVIVGMPGKVIGSDKVGAAYIFHGNSSGLSASPNQIIIGDQANSSFGDDVSTAGDVNGDGFSDVIIGASTYNTGTGLGIAFVYHGSSSGLSSTADWDAAGDNASFFGNAVSTAGDVNGDGYSDIIIGASAFTDGQSSEGAVYVFHGSAGGLSQNADWSVISNQSYASWGLDVSTAGDVNGDGYSDIVFSGTNSLSDEGVVYLYHGSMLGLSTNANWSVIGNQNFGNYGFSISTAGDMNGDGYSDLLIGQYGYDGIGSGVDSDGKVYLYEGSASGLSVNEVWSGMGGNEFRYGISVSTAGDVNGDGYSDIIIGAPGYNGTTIHGGAYLYYGNVRGSLETRMRQNKPSPNSLIASGNLTESEGSVELGLRVKSPFGRADGRMVYEVIKNGEIFSLGDSLNNSVSFDGVANFADLLMNINGRSIFATENGLESSYSDAYKWRARKEFLLVNNPFQKYGPWKYYSSFDPIQPYAFRPRVFIPLNIIAQIKVLLEGPYNEIDNMKTTLNTNIPLDSPYSEDPRTASSIPSNAVDWILVELRDKNDNTKVLVSKSAFLLQDKTIRELNGSSPLSFTLPADDYYIVIKHRNHLPIMSANPVSLSGN